MLIERAARRLKHQITTLRQASLGIRPRPVPDGTGEDTVPPAQSSPTQQPVLLFSNDGSVSIAQVPLSLLTSAVGSGIGALHRHKTPQSPIQLVLLA